MRNAASAGSSGSKAGSGLPATRFRAPAGTRLRRGDRVAVEDPGYPPVLDLLAALDLICVPMAIDELGVTPDALAGALKRGCQAVLLTPRAQSPTGAAWDQARRAELAGVLASTRRWP